MQIQGDGELVDRYRSLGWKFIRIRGSEFYRDPAKAMDRVFRELSELGIPPDFAMDVAEEESPSGDLLERVKHRAAQLLREWRDEDTEGQATDPDGAELLRV